MRIPWTKVMVAVIVAETAFLLLWIFVLDCVLCDRRPKLIWRMDHEVSEALLLGPSDSSPYLETLDALQIYEERNPAWTWYEVLADNQVIFETADKDVIRSIILSANDNTSDAPCYIQRGEIRYGLLLIDNTFMRAGYTRLDPCLDGIRQYVAITFLQSDGGGSLAFSRNLALKLKELGVQQIADPQFD